MLVLFDHWKPILNLIIIFNFTVIPITKIVINVDIIIDFVIMYYIIEDENESES